MIQHDIACALIALAPGLWCTGIESNIGNKGIQNPAKLEISFLPILSTATCFWLTWLHAKCPVCTDIFRLG